MSIETDRTITINGIEVGISKPIQMLIASGDFTYEELSRFAFVGRYDFVNDKCGSYDAGSTWSSGSSQSLMTEEKYPVLNDLSKPWDNVSYIYAGIGNRQNDNYGKIVLVYNNVSSNNNIDKNYNDNNTACIVTELNPRLLKMRCNIYSSSVNANAGESGSYNVYEPEVSMNIVWRSDDSSTPFSTLCCQKFEDISYFVFPLYNNVFTGLQDINGNVSSTNARINYMYDDFDNSGHYFSAWSSNDAVQDFLEGANYSIGFTGAHNFSDDRGDKLLTVNYTPYSASIRVRSSSLDTALKQCASCGLYFEYDGDVYKPITTDGIVTGYTDDLDKNSDWDMINDVTGNVVPDRPSGGGSGTDEDNDDAIPTVEAPFASGLARYYISTAGSLVLMHISEALGSWDLKDSGKDLYKNIISCKLIKPPTAVPSSSSVFTIYGVKPQYQGTDITIPEVTGNPSISYGSYSIPRKFNDFRDYAPYTKVEIYLPYCGWTVLPSHVVGRSISVTYYTDIIAATCKAVVYCGANVVAEAAGVIGMDIPMVAENAGAKAEAVTAGLLAYGKAGLQTALGVGAAVATKGKAGVTQATTGIGNLISSYSQTAMAFNTSFTEVNGKNGDGCCIAGISAIVIKITRPKYGANSSAPYVPAEYGHTIGFTSMKTVTVGSVTGLLIAENVDTSGIAGATERERQLIKLYLESGIFVEHPS